jgi:hypothetical protein
MERSRTVEGEGTARGARPRWSTIAVGVPAALVLGGALVAGPQETEVGPGDTIGLTREAMKEFLQLRDLISQETVKLADEKEFLADEIDLVTAQIEATRASIEETLGRIDETSKKVSELEEENESLKAATASLVEVIPGLEKRTKELIARIPAPAYELTSLPRQLLPENPDESDEKLSTRFSSVAGVLTLLDKFNTDIHSTSEIRELANGREELVTALYFGLSQAYYVNGDGTAAGRGVPSDEGYVWTSLDEAAQAVQLCVKIKNGQAAEFVQLPITID